MATEQFQCLDNPEINAFVNQDFSDIQQESRVLQIQVHEIHVTAHPNDPDLFVVFILNTDTDTITTIATSNHKNLHQIITRIVEAVITGYLSHVAAHTTIGPQPDLA